MTEVRQAQGLGHRKRRLGDEPDKERKRIGMAITRTFETIERKLPCLAEHLNRSIPTPHSSMSLSYRPAEPTDWRT